MKTRWVVAVVAAVLLAGCNSDGTGDGLAEESDREASAVADVHRKVDKIAWQFALAMEADSIRLLVRDAMRESPVSEHKLVLQEFVRTPRGLRVMAVAASAGDQDPEQLEADIAHLPPLDFYVPAREHRLSWKGTKDIAVGANVDVEAPLIGYTTAGVAENIDRRAAASNLTFVVLQPAEHKSQRVAPQAARPGAVIQDPDDGENSGSLTIRYPDGTSTTTEFAELAQFAQCTPETCPEGGGGGGGQPGSVPTYVKRIEIYEMCDNANCSEGNELHFVATATNGTTYELVKDDLHPLTNYNVNLWQLGVSPASGFFVDIRVRETDAWPNGDDHLSYVTYSPNFVGDPHLTLTDNGFTWGLKEQPNVGAFDEYKIGVRWGW